MRHPVVPVLVLVRAARGWTRPCSPHDEIKDYLRDVATTFGLLPHLRLGVEVTDATYDEETARWAVTTAAGDVLDASAVVMACGQLSRPAWPRIPGMERFAGHTFHSAEWDHDHDLRGRRVAVIGTGASAVQFVPPVAEVAGHVDVFQRSPSYMLPRRNRAYAGGRTPRSAACRACRRCGAGSSTRSARSRRSA